MKHDANFDVSLATGLEGEELLRLIAKAYIDQGEEAVEVKNDVCSSQSGNIYIECQSRGKPSGISTSQAPHWAIVLDGPEFNREIIIIIKTKRLNDICKRLKYLVSGGDSDTSLGYLVPIKTIVNPAKNIKTATPTEPQVSFIRELL